MPDLLPFPQRRSSVSLPATPSRMTLPPGASAVRRPPGLLRSIIDWFVEIFGCGIRYEEGRYLCPICLSVYSDINLHLCLYSGHCMDCHQRRVLDPTSDRGTVCSVCRSSSIVLVRRGM